MAFFLCQFMILLCSLYMPYFCRLNINLCANSFFIKAGKIILSVSVAMFSRTFCPIKRLVCILFHA